MAFKYVVHLVIGGYVLLYLMIIALAAFYPGLEECENYEGYCQYENFSPPPETGNPKKGRHPTPAPEYEPLPDFCKAWNHSFRLLFGRPFQTDFSNFKRATKKPNPQTTSTTESARGDEDGPTDGTTVPPNARLKSWPDFVKPHH